MPELTGIDIEGLEPLINGLNKLPQEIKDEAGNEVAKYLFNVLQAYPPQKRVTRQAAFDSVFFTEKQKRWFFANLEAGTLDVPYRRTQGFRKGWRIIGEGITSIIVNEAEAGPYLMGEDRQSRMMQMIGWKKGSEIIKERIEQIQRKADAGIKTAMRKAGFK